jgi:hypothetical protein
MQASCKPNFAKLVCIQYKRVLHTISRPPARGMALKFSGARSGYAFTRLVHTRCMREYRQHVESVMQHNQQANNRQPCAESKLEPA